jgi:hypothetical protein
MERESMKVMNSLQMPMSESELAWNRVGIQLSPDLYSERNIAWG